MVPVTPAIAPQVSYSYLPYATNYGYNIPAKADIVSSDNKPVDATPAVKGTNSQFHAQDDFGQYKYGYSNPSQTKQEIKTADGVTRGSYSYIDPNGLVQSVNYIADAMGFRVAATNLPVHVLDEPTASKLQLDDKLSHSVVQVQEKEENNNVLTPQVQYSYLPYAQNYGYYGVPATQAFVV